MLLPVSSVSLAKHSIYGRDKSVLKGVPMSLIPSIISNCLHNLYQLFNLGWRDVTEILFFSTALYFLLRWLNTDRTSHLIAYFYGYTFTLFVAHYARLTIISQTLFICAPIAVCIALILHQHALQKNFVGLKKIETSTTESSHWIEELVRITLQSMNSRQSLCWVIERKDHLVSAVTAPCLLYAELKKDFIELVMSSSQQNPGMFWINSNGKLISYNVQWYNHAQLEVHDWLSTAIEVSRMTDLLIVKSCASTRSFTLLAEGKLAEGLSAHQMTLLLHRLITHQSTFQEGTPYAPQNKKSSPEQQYH